MGSPSSTSVHVPLPHPNLNTNLDDIDVNNEEGLLYIDSNSDDGTETHESEFIVDDNNNLDGIDVDMTDFMEKLETESYWVGLPINNQVLDGSNVDVDPEPFHTEDFESPIKDDDFNVIPEDKSRVNRCS
ncbi:hypothetical protein L6452_09202 [Arctium lappa]|uniref:Uncharacterized protein n=1 Tax=Arctium lappa TaxID=4217 RepID=A0ACB9DK80_ARCLA|nr:hypothetical protein L6452_09202 [Arctium lappa]